MRAIGMRILLAEDSVSNRATREIRPGCIAHPAKPIKRVALLEAIARHVRDLNEVTHEGTP